MLRHEILATFNHRIHLDIGSYSMFSSGQHPSFQLGRSHHNEPTRMRTQKEDAGDNNLSVTIAIISLSTSWWCTESVEQPGAVKIIIWRESRKSCKLSFIKFRNLAEEALWICWALACAWIELNTSVIPPAVQLPSLIHTQIYSYPPGSFAGSPY